ncbi:MAG: acyl carrier protein [Lachnospiraceae bacterium]|jgi:acyl carrier protein|nr:acyl carrier protein [Lachnospiraceae bacterium]MBR7021501.1 acyl carrier protein [Lachnospiraceae bacterium]
MFDQVAGVIADVMHVSRDMITKDTMLVEDLGVDSLEMYRILLALEDVFDAQLEPATADWKVRTVGELCDRLRKTLAAM